MRLLADFRHAPRHADILILAEHAAECVTGKRPGIRLPASQNHSGIQTASQRHPDSLITAEIARQVARKSLAEFPVVSIRIEFFLVLPLAWVEVAAFPFQRSV